MAHGLQLERSDDRRHRWRPLCRCGWAGEWASSQQRAKEQYAAHRASVPARPRDVASSEGTGRA